MDGWDSRQEKNQGTRSGGHALFIWIVLVVGVGACVGLWWQFGKDVQQWLGLDNRGHSAGMQPSEPGEQTHTASVSLSYGDAQLRKLVGEAQAHMRASAVEGKAKAATAAQRANEDAVLNEWLSVPDVIQRLAAAVRMIAMGDSPQPVLAFIPVKGRFAVTEEPIHTAPVRFSRKKGRVKHVHVPVRLYVAPEGYARYEQFSRILGAFDPETAAHIYRTLHPYFEAAFQEVAQPKERFNDILAAAIKRLLSVKFPQGRIELVEKGAVYAYKDPSLESLSAAEKHLLRMGPAHAHTLQSLLRGFAEKAELKGWK